MKYVGKILTWFMCAVAILVVVVMIVMFAFGGDGAISHILWTEEMLSEYEKAPDDFYVEYITEFNDHYFTQDGYFSINAVRYIPYCEQWQMTLRYNKSTLEALGKEWGKTLTQDQDPFTFALIDDEGNVYRDFLYKKTVKGRYCYYRLIFDDITVKKLDSLELKIYCVDDMENGELPEIAVGKLPLYYSYLARKDYNFKKELPKNMRPTEGLISSDKLTKG